MGQDVCSIYFVAWMLNYSLNSWIENWKNCVFSQYHLGRIAITIASGFSIGRVDFLWRAKIPHIGVTTLEKRRYASLSVVHVPHRISTSIAESWLCS